MNAKHKGDLCDNCRVPLVARPRSGFFRGRWFALLVCPRCNAGWDDADDSLVAFAESLGASSPPAGGAASEDTAL